MIVVGAGMDLEQYFFALLLGDALLQQLLAFFHMSLALTNT